MKPGSFVPPEYKVTFSTEDERCTKLARTLYASYLGFHPKTGWWIQGGFIDELFGWVNDFYATHEDFGYVEGNFESEVRATSKKAYEDFIKHYPYLEWDYGDI